MASTAGDGLGSLWTKAIARVFDPWRRRYWRPDPVALAEWHDLRPAVVVTGASEGIGLALAQRHAKRGLTVVLVARRPEPLRQAAGDIASQFGVTAVAVPLDVTRTDACGTLETELRRHGLYADILINNAGMGLCGAYVGHRPEHIAELLDLNIRALSLLTRHFLPGMCIRGRGGVLNIASLGGYAPGPYQAAYYASKAYVLSLTEAVAWETRGLGVRVAAFAPGPIRTRFHARMGAENSLYRWLIPALSAWTAAGAAMRGFALGRRVITPGLVGPLMALVMRLTPHPISLPIIAGLLRPRGSRQDARG